MFRASITLFVTTPLVAVAAARAQQKPPQDLPVTRAEVRAIVLAAADRIERHYVDPDTGRVIGAALRRAANDTGIVGTTSSLALTRKVSKVLEAAFKDAHLAFGYSFEPQEEKEDTLLTAAENEALRREVAADGFGVTRVERLEGNIGYIGMNSFRDPEYAAEAVAGALRLVEGSRALIIDLRDSRGGAPEMVEFLASYFFKEPTQLADVYLRPENKHKQSWTTQWVPGERYPGELYVLTNHVTRSAAEAFAYHLQQRKRATVVGEVSRGGAHMGRWENVSPHFAIYVPLGRVTDPVTKTDWERTGVTPNVITPPAIALRTAHVLALEAALRGATDKDVRESLEEALTHVKATATP